MDCFSPSKSRHEERLEEFRDPQARRRDKNDGPATMSDAMTRVLERATPTLAKPLQPKNEKDADKIKSSLSYAGFRSEAATTIYLGLKFLCLVGGLMFGGGTVLLVSGVACRR